jgi:hypothetical protein
MPGEVGPSLPGGEAANPPPALARESTGSLSLPGNA